MEQILQAANKYSEGLNAVLKRRKDWLDHYKTVRERLQKIAEYLNTNSSYKQHFVVHTHRAYNDSIEGSCTEVSALVFKSGEMSQHLTFRNAIGEHAEYVEGGFELTFSPSITGQIVLMMLPHTGTMNIHKREQQVVAIIDNPMSLTHDLIDDIVTKALMAAFHTSFTGMAEQNEEMMTEQAKIQQRTPIGFRRNDHSHESQK